jgi:hypothetical protein
MVREEDALEVLKLLKEAKAETHAWAVILAIDEAEKLSFR